MDRNTQPQPSTSTYKPDEPIKEKPQQPSSPNALKQAAADCLNNWIHYLQALNSLCSAGLNLSYSLTTLSQSSNTPLAHQSHLMWEELNKATITATHTVKTHIAAAMQDMMIGETFTESDAQRQQEHNQQIITENLITFINLHYQFSIAGCEYFGSMAVCPTCQTVPGGAHDAECGLAMLQQCFGRIYGQEPQSRMSSPHFQGESRANEGFKGGQGDGNMRHSPQAIQQEVRGASPHQDVPRGPSPEIRGLDTLHGPFPNPGQLHTMKYPFPGANRSGPSRSPLHFPLFPLSGGGQRRWSEAAAGDVGGESGDCSMRRWSMPWDTGRVDTGPWQQRYLPSKLAVPVSGASQERSRSTTPEAVVMPSAIQAEGLAEAIQLLSCRTARASLPHTSYQSVTGYPSGPPPWSETHEERMHRRMYSGVSSQRGNWQSIDVPPVSSMSVTEHYDIFPSGMPLTSRKSSSSTDSSSCLSIHSRSTTSSSDKGSDSVASGGDGLKFHTNFYSMWSGSEHLPFIKLPESQEPQDDSDTEDDNSGKSLFLKPT